MAVKDFMNPSIPGSIVNNSPEEVDVPSADPLGNIIGSGTTIPSTKNFMSPDVSTFGGVSSNIPGFSSLDLSDPNLNLTDVSDDYISAQPVTTNSTPPNSTTSGIGTGASTPNNAFAFNGNSAVTENYELKFIPNILDSYDQYTYHWKLFIVSIDNASKGNVLDLNVQSIIAESAVTDLTIDKVELKSVCVPSVEGGTGTTTEVKFEIIEPSGAGLIDKLYHQALALGIGNWFVMPCYLQLEFRARDPETSASYDAPGSDTQEGSLGALSWIWPLSLTDLKAHVTHVGTRYEFSAIPYDEKTQTNANFTTQSNIVLQDLKTVQDAMTALAVKMNADQFEKLVYNYTIPDSYKIIVDPELSGLPLLTAKDGQSTAWSRDYAKFDAKTATFNAGTGIDKIIDAILSTVDQLQQEIQGSAAPNSVPLPASSLPTQMKKLWRIVTECKPIAFDFARGDNAIEMTIFVIKYDIGVLDVSAAQVGQTAATRDVAKKRIAEYVEKKILKKRYDYIFTGLNDQILNFDLNLNFAFAATMARYGGLYYDGFTQVPGVTAKNKTVDKVQNATDSVRKAISFLNSAPPDADTSSLISSASAAIQDAKQELGTDATNRLLALLNSAKPANRSAFVDAAKKTSIIAASRFASLLAQPTPVTNSNGDIIGSPIFISDVDISSAASKAAAQNLVADIMSRSSKLRPIAFREDKQEAALGFGLSPKNDASRNRTSNVFTSALYSAADGNLQQIKMTIKGDPYWLFPRPINSSDNMLLYKSDLPTDKDAIDAIKSNTSDTSVNTHATDNFIVVRFRTPKMFSDITGFINDPNIEDAYSEVETFSGVYRVISIDSKFDMGKFHQEMTCIVDPMIDLVDITNFTNDIEASATTSTQNTATTPNINSIPNTAIKNNSVLNTETTSEFGFSTSLPTTFLTDIGTVPVDPNPTEGE